MTDSAPQPAYVASGDSPLVPDLELGRRLAAVLIDWTMCQLLAFLLFHVTLGEGGPGQHLRSGTA